MLKSRLFSGILFLLSFHVSAQGYQISPVVVNIDPGRTLSGQTSFYNLTGKTSEFSVEAVAWSVKDNEPVYTETRDLVVNPNRFRVDSGQTQTIRVGLRKKPGNTELTYRLIVTEIPDKTNTSKLAAPDGVSVPVNSGLNIDRIVKFVLPVYVASPELRPVISYRMEKDGNDLLFTVVNTGTKHQTLNYFALTAGTKKFTNDSQAVLAGSTFTFRLQNWGAVTGNIAVDYIDFSQKPVHEVVQIP